MTKPLKITGKPRNYFWGGTHYIPSLFNINNDEKRPFAEWWLGAHPDNPSMVSSLTEPTTLNEWLVEHPSALHPHEKARFDSLPFLLKILDVNQMLAIQVHPTKQQAKEGFLRQDRIGIAREAFDRTYRDKNDKPEMMVSLTTCWLAHGFCDVDQAKQRLAHYPELCECLQIYDEKGIEEAVRFILSAPQPLIKAYLDAILEVELHSEDKRKSQPEYWIRKAFYEHGFGYDRSLLILLLMNIVSVPVGHGIYQDAGIPHAYLSGQLVEIMTNSDNVVRIGPTKLHVDIPELYKILRYDEVTPQLIKATRNDPSHHIAYYLHGGSNAFKLGKIDTKLSVLGYEYSATFLSILLVVQGQVVVDYKENSIVLRKGESILLPCDTKVRLTSHSCLAFIASHGDVESFDKM